MKSHKSKRTPVWIQRFLRLEVVSGEPEGGQQGSDDGVYFGRVAAKLSPDKEVAGRLPQSQGRQEQEQAEKE